MTFGSGARVLVVFAATAALAQNAQPGTTPGAPILKQGAPIPYRQNPAGRRSPGSNRTTDPQGLVAMRERVQEMEGTVSRMRLLLQQMRVRADKSKATDALTKANLDMWELMVGQLDKEFQQLRQTLAAREDLEARRADLYKQADAKAAAAAEAARAAQAARFAEAEKNSAGTPTPTPAPSGQSREPGPGAQTAPAQPSAAPPAKNPASPN